MTWAVVPAAGSGRRFGGALPKQYVEIHGLPVIDHTLQRLCSHPGVRGVVVVVSAGDPHWTGVRECLGRPVLTAPGGAERADSVLAGLMALPASVAPDDLVLVHDAARPNLAHADLDRLLTVAGAHAVGALLAAPVRDTLKRTGPTGDSLGTQPREGLWRALTPQVFRRAGLERALSAAAAAGIAVTDEAMAMERLGLFPALVEGREDNIKLTTPSDLAVLGHLLAADPPSDR